MSDITDIITEKVAQEAISFEEVKEILQTLKDYIDLVDSILENFEERISDLEA